MFDSKILNKLSNAKTAQDTVTGLLIAQTLCSRKLLEAFDNNQQDIVLSLMKEIVDAISEIKRRYGDRPSE